MHCENKRMADLAQEPFKKCVAFFLREFSDWMGWSGDVTLSTSSNQKMLCIHSENAKHSPNGSHAKQVTTCVLNAREQPLCLLQGFSASRGISQLGIYINSLVQDGLMQLCIPYRCLELFFKGAIVQLLALLPESLSWNWCAATNYLLYLFQVRLHNTELALLKTR